MHVFGAPAPCSHGRYVDLGTERDVAEVTIAALNNTLGQSRLSDFQVGWGCVIIQRQAVCWPAEAAAAAAG